MIKRKMLMVLIAGLLVLTACAGEEPAETPTVAPAAIETPAAKPSEGETPVSDTPTPEEPTPSRMITLEFWYALGGSSGEAVEALVEQFNAAHPSIQVTPTYQGTYGQVMGKVWNAIFAEQTMPHVVHLGGAPLLGATDSIIPITDFTDGPNGIDRSQIHDAFWEYNSAGGQVWSMPFNNSIPVLYYNRDLFVAAGLDPDKPPTTWDEVIEYGQKLTQDTDGNNQIDQWGFNTHSNTHWYLSTMFLENGVQIINEEQTEVLYNGPEAVKMLQLWGDMVNKHQVMPPGQHKEAKGDFLAGKSGMMLYSSSGIPSIAEEVAFELDVAMIPTIAGRDPVALVGGGSLVISKNEDHGILDAAWEFVKFMTSPEGSLYFSTHTGYVPIYKDALDWPEMQAYLEEHALT